VGGGCGGGANQSIALIVAGTFGYARHPRRPGRIVSTLTESKTTLVAVRVRRLLAGRLNRGGSAIRGGEARGAKHRPVIAALRRRSRRANLERRGIVVGVPCQLKRESWQRPRR
jgi:hypothetical protein